MLIQSMCAKLGIATGRNLPEVCRDRFPLRRLVGLWVQAELIAMATDLAEFVGAALGSTCSSTSRCFSPACSPACSPSDPRAAAAGFRRLELAITGAARGDLRRLRLYETLKSRALGRRLAARAADPALPRNGSLLLAVGIIGATVMPHVDLPPLRPHPETDPVRDEHERGRKSSASSCIDVLIAIGIAGLINMAMLAVAASSSIPPATATSPRSSKHLPASPTWWAAQQPRFRDRPARLGRLLLERRHLLRPSRDGRLRQPPRTRTSPPPRSR